MYVSITWPRPCGCSTEWGVLLTSYPLWLQHSLYVGASSGVIQLPLSSCSRYRSCYDCILARDPYCGWDANTHACVEASTIVNRSQGSRWEVLGNVKVPCAQGLRA